MKVFASSLFVAAEAGTLAVTWSDCGAKHAKVTDLQPTTIQTGTTTTLTGTGQVDEEVTAATFQATVSALGAKLTSCSGDGKTDIECKLPLNAGTITVKALSFPLQKGQVEIPVEVKTSALIPPTLAKVDVHVTATEQNGESVICLDVHTAKQTEEEVVAASCSGDDQKAIKALDDNTFGDKSNTCGKGAYNVLTGNFNHDKFNSCLSAAVGISSGCSECYAKTAEYGATHCKSKCILGWCKQGCLDCTAPAQTSLSTCTGLPAGSPKPCNEVAAEAGTLAVTWSDCGAKHAKVIDLQPTTIQTGTTTTLTGTGQVDEEVTAATFQATVSALGAQLTSCSGDGKTDIECKLPLNAGTITVKALSFPLQKGQVEIPVEVKTSALIPPTLAKVDVHVTATEQNGESVICLDVHTAKHKEEEEVVATVV